MFRCLSDRQGMIHGGCLFWSIQGPVPDVGNKNFKMLFRMK